MMFLLCLSKWKIIHQKEFSIRHNYLLDWIVTSNPNKSRINLYKIVIMNYAFDYTYYRLYDVYIFKKIISIIKIMACGFWV